MPSQNTLRTTVPEPNNRENGHGQPCLVVISGSLIGLRAEIVGDRFLIGRSEDANLSIPSTRVSREHCAITRIALTGGVRFEIRDLGSTNKTYVNDTPITVQVLTNGDLIRVGDCVFKYFEAGSVEMNYQQQLLEFAVTDALTGLSNRRQFLSQFQNQIIEATNHQLALTLVLMDLDHFKAINDVFGHLDGDQVLSACGELLRAGLSKPAIAARIGGEEFAILLPQKNLAEGLMIAEDVRAKLERLKVQLPTQAIFVTASFGCAEFSAELNSASSMMRAADLRLYQAKEAGRNCVR